MTESRVNFMPTQVTGNVVRDSNMSLVPETLEPYLELNKALWYDGPLSAAELEMIRLRNARKVGCVFCKAVRYDVATQAGLNEDKIAQIDDDYHRSDLSEREKLLLAFADQYLDAPEAMSEQLKLRLQKTFTASELTHMSTALLMFNAMSRAAVTFGGMPEHELPPMVIGVPQ